MSANGINGDLPLQIKLHNAVVDGRVPPPPNPMDNPGPFLSGLLGYVEAATDAGEEVTAEELVQVLAQLLDQRQWEHAAVGRLMQIEAMERRIVVPGEA